MAGPDLFRNPALFSILTQDARTSSMVGDPNLLKAIVHLQSKPELYNSYLRQDARLSTVLEVLLDRAEKSHVAPSHRPTDFLWGLMRNGTEEEITRVLNSMGTRHPAYAELGPYGLTLLMEAAVRKKKKGERLVPLLLSLGANGSQTDGPFGHVRERSCELQIELGAFRLDERSDAVIVGIGTRYCVNSPAASARNRRW